MHVQNNERVKYLCDNIFLNLKNTVSKIYLKILIDFENSFWVLSVGFNRLMENAS